MQTLRKLTFVSLFLACTPKEADSDGDSSSGAATDGVGATSASATDPTTGATTTTGATVTASATSTTGDMTTTGDSTSTGDTSTTGPDPTTVQTSDPVTTTPEDTEGNSSLPEACVALCTHLDGCKPGVVGPVDQCIAECSEDTSTPPCTAAIAEQWACVAGLSCEEALKFVESTPTSCLPEIAAADQACMDEGCSGEVGGGGPSCEFQQQCEGLKQTIKCEGDMCTCIENGLPIKDCPADGLCDLDPEENKAAINTCCGWDWE